MKDVFLIEDTIAKAIAEIGYNYDPLRVSVEKVGELYTIQMTTRIKLKDQK